MKLNKNIRNKRCWLIKENIQNNCCKYLNKKNSFNKATCELTLNC